LIRSRKEAEILRTQIKFSKFLIKSCTHMSRSSWDVFSAHFFLFYLHIKEISTTVFTNYSLLKVAIQKNIARGKHTKNEKHK
jgi:hypothetical protein